MGAIEGPQIDLAKHMGCGAVGWEGYTRQRGLLGTKALREAPPPQPGSAATQAWEDMNGSFMPWTRARSGRAAPFPPALGS